MKPAAPPDNAFFRDFLKLFPPSQRIVVSGIVVGLASGLSVYGFVKLLEFFNISCLERAQAWPPQWGIPALAGLPALGGLVAGWLCHRYCPDAKGSGVTNVTESIRERGGHMRGRISWVTALASSATIGLGGSAGKEGPVVQIGASVGSKLGQLLGTSEKNLKVLAAAGAAGGLAASFSIPLAGVFFTMEVILQDFAHEALSAVVLSSVAATVTARLLLGNKGFFTPVSYQWRRPSELVLYAILGVLCAPMGLLYRKSLSVFETLFSRERFAGWTRPMAGGLLVGFLGLFLPDVLGEGHGIANDVLMGRHIGLVMLVLLIFGKILSTSLTLGSGGAGGNLMPGLFVGVMVGDAWGEVIRYGLGNFIQPGAYAVVGMASFFTAAFQAPVTGIVMAFEMTRDFGILMPVMFACTLAFIFSRGRMKAHQ